MIRKITTISFIFLFIFLIGTVSATSLENETQTIEISDKQEQIEISHENSLQANVKTPTTISSPPVEMYYKDGSKLIATLTDDINYKHYPISNAKVIFNVNGANYTRITDSNGQAMLTLNLESGEYNAKAIYEGCDFYYPSSSISKITIKPTINGDDLVKYHKNDTQYYVEFTDNKGSPLSNTEITFNINGVFYKKTTNTKGIAKLSINLDPGTYIITSYNPKTSEQRSNEIRVLATISSNYDLVKYYTNKKTYSVHIHNLDGSYAKGSNVTFNINGVFYTRTSDNTGYASLKINLNPGHYKITAMYKNCFVSNNITVKSTIQTKDLEMNFKDGSAFETFITTNEGKPIGAGKNVTFNINGVFYTRTTNLNSAASLNINLNPGKYLITTYHNNSQIGNKILIHPANSTNISKNLNKDFTYEIAIPNYANVTMPNVMAENNYTVKLGEKGIVKLPKNQIFEVNNGLKTFTLSNYKLENNTSVLINDKYVFIPFGESKLKTGKTTRIQKNSGILIYSSENYTHIRYYNTADRDISQFGISIDKEGKMAERINYIENGEIRASILFNTTGFDEYGIRYNLVLANGYNPETDLDKNYITISKNRISPIKFTSTNETITLNIAREKIVGYITNEKLETTFKTNNNLVEKTETITYGTHPKYNSNNNFEIVQSYAIINSKVTPQDIENLAFGIDYLTSYKLKYVQGMFLAGLNTAYLSDLNADKYAKHLSLNWQRTNTSVILGGVDNDKIYLHIANPNMGMSAIGKNTTKITEFNFMTSLLLSKIEQQVMNPIEILYNNNVSSSFDEVIGSLLKSEVSIVNHGDCLYIFCENGNNSAIIINTTTGICKSVLVEDGFAYKGATQKTDKSDCTLCMVPKLIEESLYNQFQNIQDIIDNGISQINKNIDNLLENIHPTTSILYQLGTTSLSVIGLVFSGTASVLLFPATFAVAVQKFVNNYRVTFVDKKDTHLWYEHITLSRPGYFQDTKLFLIPKENGQTDYIEVHINSDNSLNRSQAKYISNGNVKQLTKEETYQYFDEEYWDPINTPRKLWIHKW